MFKSLDSKERQLVSDYNLSIKLSFMSYCMSLRLMRSAYIFLAYILEISAIKFLQVSKMMKSL